MPLPHQADTRYNVAHATHAIIHVRDCTKIVPRVPDVSPWTREKKSSRINDISSCGHDLRCRGESDAADAAANLDARVGSATIAISMCPMQLIKWIVRWSFYTRELLSRNNKRKIV